MPRTCRAGRRTTCVIAGVLCLLGILTSVTIHGNQPHHSRLPALGASVVVNLHGATARDQHAMPTSALPAAGSRRWASPAAAPSLDADAAPVETVRTRGPPAAAA